MRSNPLPPSHSGQAHCLLPRLAVVFALGLAVQGAAIEWRQCLRQPSDWYATPEAVRIADNVLLYQRASGGWPKNLDLAAPLDPAERRQVAEDRPKTDSTIDNNATIRPLRFLARVAQGTGETRFRDGFLAGLDFLFAAQYPNGGWPQFFPQPRGYSAHITFNDGAMVNVLELLRDIAQARSEYAFLDERTRGRAERSVARGVECILRCQIIVDGERTAWCAQHDEHTLDPAPARSYEKVSVSGSESVGVVRFLMGIEEPGPEVSEAIEAAVAWFRKVQLAGIRQVQRPDASLPRGYDKVILPDDQAPALWARFYEIGTNRPIFCGRDGVIKYHLAEIEHERRVGYSWYTDAPARLIEQDYPQWRRQTEPGRSEPKP